jgi:membrane associated rhomboid family serine protease
MPMPVNACPKCGAMIVPQLARCRQCKTYLHGTNVEGFLFEHLVPAQLQRSPGTATLSFLICLFYALMLALAGEGSLFGFSGYTLIELGAVHGPSVLRGQAWRFVTSIFGHHDLLHLVLNLSSLVAVGAVVERIFDPKKMMLIYLASGVASMAISFVWYVYVIDQPMIVSAGASGAVCGMIGAAWFGARKLGPEGADVVRRMKWWSVLMLIWGFRVPGINNSAHIGGFIVGALLAHFVPAGITKSVGKHKALSFAMLGALATGAGSAALMIENLRGFPVALEADVAPRAILGHVYYEGHAPEHSDQIMAWQSCEDALRENVVPEEALRRCELNVRINDGIPASYTMLSKVLEQSGDHDRAHSVRSVGARIDRAHR